MSATELKPCPFCGKSTAYFSGVHFGTKLEQWRLVHDDDYCHMTIKTEWNWTKEECVKQWNERMP